MKVTILDALELAVDVGPVIREALRKRGPGGRRITAEERAEIVDAFAKALDREIGERT
jgi:acyl-CoA reductase-like NAD-dependent aldehyde dehydrogenase